MFDSIFKEFDVNLMKCNNIAESAYDIFKIKTGELNILANQGYFTESEIENGGVYVEAASEFMKKIKEFFKKIATAIKEFVEKLRNTIDAKMFASKINSQCKEIKKELAKNAAATAKLKNKKTPFFDGIKAYRAYSKYISATAIENKKLFSREYDSLDDYVKAAEETHDKLEKLIETNDITTMEDYCKIDMTLINAINHCPELAAGMAKVADLFYADLFNYVNIMEGLAESEDDASKVRDIENETSKEVTRAKSFMSNYFSKTKAAISKVLAEVHSAISSSNKNNDEENTEDTSAATDEE